jgi:hypothetical protein
VFIRLFSSDSSGFADTLWFVAGVSEKNLHRLGLYLRSRDSIIGLVEMIEVVDLAWQIDKILTIIE